MPIRTQIDLIRKRLNTRCEGLVTFAEMREHVRMELTPEAASFAELADCTGATTNATAGEIRQLAAERESVDSRQRRPGPVAIVATNSVFFGMFRMFDALTEEIRPIRVFSDLQEAEQWLEEVSVPSPVGATPEVSPTPPPALAGGPGVRAASTQIS